LEALARFDQEMVRRVEELQAKVDAVEQAIEDRENIPQAVRDLIQLLSDLNQQWRRRRDAMRDAVQ